ncbi:MAG: hypothetical protein ACREX7_10465 [Casimicrobiaceae bacterium]
MNFDKAIARLAAGALLSAAMLAPLAAHAQDKPYAEGSVWNVSMVRVKAGMFDAYMQDILPLRKKINEEAIKQGFLLSSHILTGSAVGRDDWNLIILDEFKNWAAFDGLSAKYEAIAHKFVGSEEVQTQIMSKRQDVREILANKPMQEILIR